MCGGLIWVPMGFSFSCILDREDAPVSIQERELMIQKGNKIIADIKRARHNHEVEALCKELNALLAELDHKRLTVYMYKKHS